MNKITKQSDKEGHVLAKKHPLIWLRIFVVWFGSLPIVAGLIALAALNSFAFEIAACLVWSACFVWVSWVPLRDTSALALRYKFDHTTQGFTEKMALRRFRVAQLSSPFLLAGIYAFSRTDLGRTDQRGAGAVVLALVGGQPAECGHPQHARRRVVPGATRERECRQPNR